MTNRLDRVMRGLEALQNDADGIIDAHTTLGWQNTPRPSLGARPSFALLPYLPA
jgi:hypothetical protein